MIIYKTTNLVNGKIYVGQDSKNNPKYLGSGKILKRAIIKYGKDNFKKEILEICNTKDELDNAEKYWIKELKAIENGYNIAEGGNGCLGCKLTDNHKMIISQANLGKIMSSDTKLKLSKAHLGKILSNETRKKISKNHKNVKKNNNPMFMHHHSIQTKHLISIKNSGKKRSLDQINTIKENATGSKNSQSKLTQKDVLEIRENYFIKNQTLTKISENYPVNVQCIYKIVKYKTWTHLP